MPKQPQDHKPAGAFEWTSPSGEVISLPAMNAIKGGLIRKHRKLSEVDFMFTIVEAVADSAELAKIDNLDVGDMNDLFQAWQDAEDGASFPQSSSSST